MDFLLSIALGVGLAACAGFRVFVPLLLTSVAMQAGFVNVAPGFEWMGSWAAFAVLLAATAAEIGAYYVPWLDNLLDTIAAPAAVAAGTLLTTSFVEINNPVLQWGLGLIVGGGTAGFVQIGTTLTRLASTKLSGGLANPVVSTVENFLAIVLSLTYVLAAAGGGFVGDFADSMAHQKNAVSKKHQIKRDNLTCVKLPRFDFNRIYYFLATTLGASIRLIRFPSSLASISTFPYSSRALANLPSKL